MSEARTGAGCAVAIVVLSLVPLALFYAAGAVLDKAANERAAAINAQANLVIAQSISYQMDAATTAVQADTRAAHAPGVGVAQTALGAAFGALTVVVYDRVDRRRREAIASKRRAEAMARYLAEEARWREDENSEVAE